MKPTTLEETVNETYGDQTIHVSPDGETVVVSFQTTGQPRVRAKQAVKELTALSSSWTATETTNDLWVFEYDNN